MRATHGRLAAGHVLRVFPARVLHLLRVAVVEEGELRNVDNHAHFVHGLLHCQRGDVFEEYLV